MSAATDAILAYGLLVPGEVMEDMAAVTAQHPEFGGDVREYVNHLVYDLPHVLLTKYCTASEPMWLLATHEYIAHRGAAFDIPADRLKDAETNPRLQAALYAATIRIGFTPAGGAAWRLVSYWDGA
jgi:hypothetical protein